MSGYGPVLWPLSNAHMDINNGHLTLYYIHLMRPTKDILSN